MRKQCSKKCSEILIFEYQLAVMKNILLLLFAAVFVSCANNSEELSAEAIVEKTIQKAGGERYKNAEISFDFRNRKYRSSRNNGLFELSRAFRDSTGNEVRDVLNNKGMQRFMDGRQVEIHDTLATAYGESVNAVHYFVQLPYGLNDEAVEKNLIGQDTINGKTYYELEVTFNQLGGGTDHEDIYMYWIQKEDFTIDFMAYRFFTDDGGIRFRVAVNPRTVNGIRFVDYINYKTDDLSTPLEQLDELYTEDKLVKVSEIRNKNIRVQLN
jgi:hypothetical protein